MYPEAGACHCIGCRHDAACKHFRLLNIGAGVGSDAGTRIDDDVTRIDFGLRSQANNAVGVKRVSVASVGFLRDPTDQSIVVLGSGLHYDRTRSRIRDKLERPHTSLPMTVTYKLIDETSGAREFWKVTFAQPLAQGLSQEAELGLIALPRSQAIDWRRSEDQARR